LAKAAKGIDITRLNIRAALFDIFNSETVAYPARQFWGGNTLTDVAA
jgi:hypothetical protein